MPLPPQPQARVAPAADGAGEDTPEWEVVQADPNVKRAPFALPSLREPVDVAVAPSGDVFVLDRGTRRVHCFDAAGRHKFTVRSRPESEGWPDPRAVAAAADGSLLVLDARLGSVFRFSPEGRFVSVRVVDDAYSPSGLARAPDGAILIADTGASRVVRWPALEGDAVEESPGPPGEKSPLAQPAALAVAADGKVYVSDVERQAVVVLDDDLREVASWPLPMFDPVNAAHLIAGTDRLLVSLPDRGEIAVFDLRGQRLGSVGDGITQRPVGMAVAAGGELIVADPRISAVLVMGNW